MEKENEIELLVKAAYRENLSREVARPEVQEGKKLLLASFYGPAQAPALSFTAPGFWIPSLALCAALFFMAQVQTRIAPVEGPSAPIYRTFGEVIEKARAEEKRIKEEIKARKAAQAAAQKTGSPQTELDDPLRNHMKPRVVVKRVSSRTGSTMVYQRSYRNNPVTVIWVFPGPGGAK